MASQTTKWLGGAALALSVAFGASTAHAVPVSLELSLLVDVSGSVDSTEYALQLGGYQSAFNSVAVQTAIANTSTGSIAINLVQWSGATEQQQSLGWTLVTAGNAGAVGDSIAALVRAFAGSTAPGSAINYATPLFDNNGFEGTRLVIDVSGDGEQNDGADTATARDAALAAGIDTINGIAIGGDPAVFSFYQTQVIGGVNAFALEAATFGDFADVIERKLVREVNPVPEPASLLLLGAGLASLGIIRRRSRR